MLVSFCFKLQSDLSELLQPALRPLQLETKRVSEKNHYVITPQTSMEPEQKPCKDDIPLTRHLTYIAFTVREGRKSEVPQDLLFSSKLAQSKLAQNILHLQYVQPEFASDKFYAVLSEVLGLKA